MFTSTRIFKKCGVKFNSGGRETLSLENLFVSPFLLEIKNIVMISIIYIYVHLQSRDKVMSFK